ncbi:MAG: dihydrofolate reductase family protein [Chloroflexi bacterium]|nr:dihydrofolate reductase family protein [Chloroflexota bacterium]
MGKVVYDISMSLDGFVAAANVRPEAGLGDGGERLHEWAFNSDDPRNRQFLEVVGTTGAVIVGRTTYDLSIPYWGADGPTGSARIPTVVVSHSVPGDIPGGSVYIFADSIESAFEKAKQAAGDKDIGVAGANTAQQLITLGFIDEILVHVVPVMFGSGVRFFEQPDGEHVSLETIEVIETKEIIHLRFRVIK